MSESAASNSFIEKYRREKFEECTRVCSNPSSIMPPGKPDFINEFQVNDREVFFLGNLDIEDTYEGLKKKYLEIKSMVIPKYSIFIDADGLKDDLYKSDNQDGETICVKDYSSEEKKLEKSILLRTCIGVHEEEDRNFHFCENDDDFTEEGDSACCRLATKIHFDSTGKLQYGLLPFYISWTDIEGEENDKHWILKERLIKYFAHYNKLINEKKIDGVFLIPRIQVDQSIIYLCLLNQPSADGKYEGSIKEALCYWFKKIDCVNEKPDKRKLMIKGDDLFLCNIEQWSIKIGCLATPVVKCEDECPS